MDSGLKLWLFVVSVPASAFGGMLDMASGILVVPILTMFGHIEIHSANRDYPSAAASLREGLDETLTVTRLELPRSFTRVLSSTNLIETLFSRARDMARRVRRWQGGGMTLRWTAAGVLEAERNFRKVDGYRSLATLDAALRAHDAALNNRKQAA